MDKYLNKIVEGNCVEVMRQFDDNTFKEILIDEPKRIYKESFERIKEHIS